MNNALQDTLDEVKYNASKQEEVVSSMLSHIVNNYKDAYDKINQIIGNTGFKPSDDFQQNIDNLGTQSGANNQIQDSNTIAPNYTLMILRLEQTPDRSNPAQVKATMIKSNLK